MTPDELQPVSSGQQALPAALPAGLAQQLRRRNPALAKALGELQRDVDGHYAADALAAVSASLQAPPPPAAQLPPAARSPAAADSNASCCSSSGAMPVASPVPSISRLMRPSLSIVVSEAAASDSSDGDGSSSGGSAAGSPGGQQAAGAAAGEKQPATAADSGADDSGDDGGKAPAQQQQQERVRRKPGTPGAALHKPLSIFSAPAADDGHCSCAQQQAAAAGPCSAGAPGGRKKPQRQQRRGHELKRRALTPGASLGRPISIFSAGSSSEGGRAAGDSSGSASSRRAGQSQPDGAQGQAEARQAQQQRQQPRVTKQQRDNKQRWGQLHVSRRPPTPGASLGRPLGVFSGDRGANTNEQQQCSVAAPAAQQGALRCGRSSRQLHSPGAVHKRTAGRPHALPQASSRLVSFAACESDSSSNSSEQDSSCDSDGDAGQQQEHHQADASVTHAVQLPGHQQQQQQQQQQQLWQSQLSCRRPPTPGCRVGQPVSICSSTRPSSAPPGAYKSSSSSKAVAAALLLAAEPSRRASSGELSEASSAGSRHLVSFGDAPLAALAAEHRSLHAAPAAVPASAAQARRCWFSKLADRPPTPGAALGRPVSVFAGGSAQDASTPVTEHSSSTSMTSKQAEQGVQASAGCSTPASPAAPVSTPAAVQPQHVAAAGACRRSSSEQPRRMSFHEIAAEAMTAAAPRGTVICEDEPGAVRSQLARRVSFGGAVELADVLPQQQQQTKTASCNAAPDLRCASAATLVAAAPTGAAPSVASLPAVEEHKAPAQPPSIADAAPASGSQQAPVRGTRAALLQRNPELALEEQQQVLHRKLGKLPTTPGAGLGGRQASIFSGDGDDSSGSSSPAFGSAAASAAPPRAVTPRQLLLQYARGVAADCERASSQRPPTPGAWGGDSIFRDIDSGGAAAATSQPPPPPVRMPAASPQPGDAAHAAILAHSRDVALDKQQQWERAMARRPPTPAAAQPVSIFSDGHQPALPAGSRSPHSTGSTAGPAGRQSPDGMPGRQLGSTAACDGGGGTPSGDSAGACCRSPLRRCNTAEDPDPARRSPLRQCSPSNRPTPLLQPAVAPAAVPPPTLAPHSASRLSRSTSPADRDPACSSPLSKSSSSSNTVAAAPAASPRTTAAATAALVRQAPRPPVRKSASHGGLLVARHAAGTHEAGTSPRPPSGRDDSEMCGGAGI